MYNIGIIGLGLMGGSLGLAIHKYMPEVKVSGNDQNDNNLKYALDSGIIDDKLNKKSIKKLDLLFIAVPVRSIYRVIQEYYPLITVEKTLVTDMGSTKSFLENKMNSSFPALKYVGGHPLTGKEVSGPQGAESDLFDGKKYILIKQHKQEIAEDRNKLVDILEKIGSNIIYMTPQKHDRLLAFSSHLPQLLSTSLILDFIEIERDYPEINKLIASGFMDMTRIAASDPDMWVDIFMSNKNNINRSLDNYIAVLKKTKEIINSNDKDKIYKFMNDASEKRKDI